MLDAITVKKGRGHISGADMQSLNRGVFGKGRYILEDSSGNSLNNFLVNAADGQITIPPRSMIWSGIHIRNTSSLVLNYTPPTVTSTVSVWLHYVKNADTSVADVTATVTIDNQPQPILDEIEDNTIEAYTLLYSFSHNVATTQADNATVSFTELKSLQFVSDDLKSFKTDTVAEIKKVDNARINSHNTIVGYINDTNAAVAAVQGRVSTLENKAQANEILHQNAGSLSTITVQKPITEFKSLAFCYNSLGGNEEWHTVPALAYEYYHVFRDYKISAASIGNADNVELIQPRVVIHGEYPSSFSLQFIQNGGGTLIKVVGIH